MKKKRIRQHKADATHFRVAPRLEGSTHERKKKVRQEKKKKKPRTPEEAVV